MSVAVQTQNHDQDSYISFMRDIDEEIDTGEIEEKDWIEHMKRSTATAIERMKTAKIPCCNEMAFGSEYCIASRALTLSAGSTHRSRLRRTPSGRITSVQRQQM